MQILVFLTYFFKSYQRKTFGGSARPPPPLVKEALNRKSRLINCFSTSGLNFIKGFTEFNVIIVFSYVNAWVEYVGSHENDEQIQQLLRTLVDAFYNKSLGGFHLARQNLMRLTGLA